MEAKKVDIFGSFLTGSALPPAGAAAADGVPVAGAMPAASPDLEKALLALLARAGGPVDLKELLGQTMGSPTRVLPLLDDMAKVGLVTVVEGEGGARGYTATDLGTNLAS